MNKSLKKISLLVGFGILFVSMYWSQDGFNFDVAGDSGYTTEALAIGWFLAVAVTVVQFVFSSNFRELNMSLIAIGAIAYVYSIDTNISGILNFMGQTPDIWWARGLGFLMDATAEPLIAWSLGVSRDGDFVGNVIKTIVQFFNGIFDSVGGNSGSNRPQTPRKSEDSAPFRPNTPKKGGDMSHLFRNEQKPFGERREGKKHVNMANLRSADRVDEPRRVNFDD